jgi:hypothetical protein
MSDIRLSVSASLDEDVSGLFKPVVPAAERYGELSGQAFARGFQRGAGKGVAGAVGGASGAGPGVRSGGGSSQGSEQRKQSQQEKAEAVAAARKERDAKRNAQRAEAEQNRKFKAEVSAFNYVERIRTRHFEQERANQEKKAREEKSAQQRKDTDAARSAKKQEADANKAAADARRRAKAEENEAEAANRRKARREEYLRKYIDGVRSRSMLQEQRAGERDDRKKERLQNRNAAIEERDSRSFGQRTSYSAARTFERLSTSGVRYASDFARSAGVQLDLGGAVGKAVDLRKMASELSNSAYMPGAKGANGQRTNARELERLARDTGNMAGFDASETLGGLKDYVGKTGDLSTGRELLKEMAVLAKATGTDLSDMISAAGDAANAIDETPGALAKGESKAAKIAGLMRTIAGQGKLGAVEISNLATQMAKLSASSMAFDGDQVANLADMGTLVQMARSKGGASSATSAATSVASFVNLIKTPARMREYERATGEKVYNEDTGKFKSVEQIVLTSLKATGANPEALKKIFANAQGERAVSGFATTYRDAGGGEAGLTAVKAEFEKYRKIQMGQGEIKDSFNNRMADYDSQVTLFNNKIAEVGATLAERMLPQLNAIAPSIIKVVGSFGDLVAWAAQNPFRAVVSALGVSIMKAGIESVLRSGIESALKSAFSPGAAAALSGGTGKAAVDAAKGGAGMFPSSPGGTMGKALAAAGAGLAITATAITIAEVGMMAIDKVFKQKEDAESKVLAVEIEASNKNNAAKAEIEAARLTPEEQKKNIASLKAQGRHSEAADAELDLMLGRTTVSKETYGRLQQNKADIDRRVEAGSSGTLREDDPFTWLSRRNGLLSEQLAGGLSGALSYVTAGEHGTSFDAQSMREASAAKIGELKAEQQRTNEILASIKVAAEKGGIGTPTAPTAGTTAITP